MLTLLHHAPHLLSRAEIARELAHSKEPEPPDIEIEIANLRAAGLVNVCGDLIGTSRAARYMDHLLGAPI